MADVAPVCSFMGEALLPTHNFGRPGADSHSCGQAGAPPRLGETLLRHLRDVFPLRQPGIRQGCKVDLPRAFGLFRQAATSHTDGLALAVERFLTPREEGSRVRIVSPRAADASLTSTS